MSRVILPGVLALSVLAMIASSGAATAKGKSSPRPINITKHVDTASPSLRGSAGNDRKGGRYLGAASTSAKKLPGKKKPPTLTLKRGKNSE